MFGEGRKTKKTPTKHSLKVQQEVSLSGGAPESGNGRMQAHKYLARDILSLMRILVSKYFLLECSS